MKCLDLFSGTRSIAKAFEDIGWEVFTVELNRKFKGIDLYEDIMKVTAEDILQRFGHPDVIWASPPCFVENTLILTEKGFKHIKDIREGDFVLTHKSRFEKVTATGRKKTDETLIIKASSSIPVETTMNHPFYVRTKERVWNNKKRGWDMVYGLPMWIPAEELEKTRHMVGFAINRKAELPVWSGVVKTIKNQVMEKAYSENNLSRYFESPAFWWIIGRYMGDGWVRSTPVTNEFIICCAFDEEKEITEKLDSLGEWFKYRVSKERTTKRITVSKKELVSYVQQFGKYAHGKHLTGDILNLPVALLRSFLDGYISADGSIIQRKNAKILQCSSVSRELIQGIAECIVKAYRKPVSINVSRKAGKEAIQGREVTVRDVYILKAYLEAEKSYSFIENDVLWTNIKKIDRKSEDTYVYNLAVNNDNSYTANGLIVHNCEKFSVAAIGHYWNAGSYTPKTQEAREALALLEHTVELIRELSPTYFFIENPRGMMRKMECLKGIPLYTVTYCQYGDTRQKPTDIWTNHPNPQFKPMCKPGDPCHIAAPRGTTRGTQGIRNIADRARIPEQLCYHIANICVDGISKIL